ncbi:hypothetical protein ABTZ99_26535 [Actinosynnema sp. NPDC002837]
MLHALGISGIVLPPAVVTVVLLLRRLGLAGSAARARRRGPGHGVPTRRAAETGT